MLQGQGIALSGVTRTTIIRQTREPARLTEHRALGANNRTKPPGLETRVLHWVLILQTNLRVKTRNRQLNGTRTGAGIQRAALNAEPASTRISAVGAQVSGVRGRPVRSPPRSLCAERTLFTAARLHSRERAHDAMALERYRTTLDNSNGTIYHSPNWGSGPRRNSEL